MIIGLRYVIWCIVLHQAWHNWLYFQPWACIANFQFEVKECCALIVLADFSPIQSPATIMEIVQAQLSNYRYTCPIATAVSTWTSTDMCWLSVSPTPMGSQGHQSVLNSTEMTELSQSFTIYISPEDHHHMHIILTRSSQGPEVQMVCWYAGCLKLWLGWWPQWCMPFIN